ncbi:hypothetical protein X769_24635 [Mesorhizobium sp. LSJC268A00]|jgi:hypothetical protein|uniref:hypothetical protein n=1 Tax=unclassified Mesorhizobium TaxID=325217 RepID=UPI0003CE7F27|nr:MULTISPECIES: hypothetical protein [unclassified Mesorhizobium]ESW99089.1 hypothetical protein X769_24635 [Mesorhizobium sp. LSJC268A00]ESX13884.1 hypothetical protein X768_03085 [Mesorhizobium sp. LSJC265A00]ESX45028.1 hypothetical protein X762_26690 [Mesorhizobium sp. LSHC426A00]ESX51386.1 hypothetical protein X761_24435 [Mesorhizobium sp. LSHC424B00]ESX66532.1 hypothetical protein X758_26680 [Mesorhizobium sp. LSHC416B00]
MRKLLLASAIAITAAAAMIAPANAGGRVVIGIGNGYYDDDYNDSYGDYYDRYAPRPYYQYDAYDNGFRYHRYHRHHRHCRIELVKHWRHHHRIVEEIRVCER